MPISRNAADVDDGYASRARRCSRNLLPLTQPERCTRIVMGLLALERQGRHAELIEGRRKLREAHPVLFARYMQDR